MAAGTRVRLVAAMARLVVFLAAAVVEAQQP